MVEYLLDNIPVLLLTVIAFAASILYILEFNKNLKNRLQAEKLLEEFRQKGLEDLHQSFKKSQDIIGTAELEGLKVLTGARIETSKIEEAHARELSNLVDRSQKAILDLEQKTIDYMQSLQQRSSNFEAAANKVFESRVNQMFAKLEERLTDFLTSTEQKTTQSIELEVKAARNLIESYKEQQLKLIDENIIAMMEQTLNMVLAKKLTLKDQLDLVYEALEKAKVEKFIV